MAETSDLMPDGTPAIRPIEKAASYAVYACDGFYTSFKTAGDDTTYQFSFWADDVTPMSEDLRTPITDIGHFTVTLTHVFQTAVKLNPNIAMQLALNILSNLARLPDGVKDRYSIPRDLPQQREMP